MSEIVLMADPRVSAVPVDECGERLADARMTMLVDARKEVDSDAHFYLREGVLERLRAAEAALPDGLRLLLVEGYRPPWLQHRYFEEYAAELRVEHPSWPVERLRVAASRFVAPPEVAPHTAGAAVDVTLADEDGNELDMGTAIDATPEESEGGCYTGAAAISAEARARRAVLGDALAGAGLVNYPTEWWHWSYGDRYWALATGARAALYEPL